MRGTVASLDHQISSGALRQVVFDEIAKNMSRGVSQAMLKRLHMKAADLKGMLLHLQRERLIQLVKQASSKRKVGVSSFQDFAFAYFFTLQVYVLGWLEGHISLHDNIWYNDTGDLDIALKENLTKLIM
jgi:hypothetical protein